MINVALQFTYHTDVISVPDSIGLQIRKYQNLFDKWLYDKNNEHNNWVVLGDKKAAVSFDTLTFVNYLNQYHISEKGEKCYVVEMNCVDTDIAAVVLYF